MKLSSYLFLSLGALAGLASCSSDADSPSQRGGSGSPVVVRATLGDESIFTRTNPAATNDSALKIFTPGDEIYVNDGQQGAEYTLANDGKTWEYSSNTFLTWHQDNVTFTAQYPTNDFVGVDRNQTTLEALKANDYMKAAETIKKEPTDHTLTLHFKRQTARVIVNIVGYNNEFSDPNNVSVSDMDLFAATDASVANDVSPISTYTAEPNKRFVALACETSKGYAYLEFTVTAQGESKVFSVFGLPELQAGMSYTFNITVGKDKAEIVDVSVLPWDSQTLSIRDDDKTFSENRFAAVKAQDVGKVVAKDGTLWATVQEAQQAGKIPVAMIAYVGDTGNPEYPHGLAIEFENMYDGSTNHRNTDNGEIYPEYAAEVLEYFSRWNNVPNASEWRLPSANDIKLITAGAGADNSQNEFRLPTDADEYGWTAWSSGNLLSNLDACIASVEDEPYYSDPSNHKLYRDVFDPSGGYDTTAYGWILLSDNTGKDGEYYVYDVKNSCFRLFKRNDPEFNREFSPWNEIQQKFEDYASVAIRAVFAF